MQSYEHEYNDEPNPRAVANPFSIVFFWWTIKIFRKRLSRDFEEYDLYHPLTQHSSKYLGNMFCTEWDRLVVQQRHRRKQRGPRVWKVLVRLFGPELFLYGFLYFLVEVVRYVFNCQRVYTSRLSWEEKDLQIPVKMIPILFYTTLYAILTEVQTVNTHTLFQIRPNFLVATLLIIIDCPSLSFHQPLFLSFLLKYFTEENKRNTNPPKHTYLDRLLYYNSPNQSAITEKEAYFFGSCIIVCSAFSVFITHPILMGCTHVGMKIRVACCSAIYRKALRISKSALHQTSAGQILNIMSNDVNRFDTSAVFIHHIWVGPIETLCITLLLYRDMGMAAVYGILAILSLVPFEIYLGFKTAKLRANTAKLTDERVRVMTEIIQSMDVIKMFTWEPPFVKLVHDIRRKEIDQIAGTSYIRGIIMSFIMFTSRLGIFITIITYVFLGMNVTAEKVFLVTAYYNILRTAMTVYFVQGVAQVAELYVAIDRIQTFMDYNETNEPDLPPARSTGKTKKRRNIDSASSRNSGGFSFDESAEVMKTASSRLKYKKQISDEDLGPGIRLRHVYAKWRKYDQKNDLCNITLYLETGTVCAVTGAVGSGKSSLLYLLLKEIPIVTGTARINGSMSYASQEPWLFVGTVRQNILFGQDYDRGRYRAVVSACVLDRDFELLPHGDHSIVGERGVSLSGGQRARVNLARAIYKKSDIYLLDDPLSAVDTKVGIQLFQNCVLSYLRGKTVVLVTHQLQYLKDVHHIILMGNGYIEAQGTFTQILESGIEFAKLLKDMKQTGEFESDHEKESKIAKAGASTMPPKQLSVIMIGLAASASSLSQKLKTRGPQEAEVRSRGRVSTLVYSQYFRAGGSCPVLILLLVLFISAQAFVSLTDFWVGIWVNTEEQNKVHGDVLLDRKMCIIIYSVLIVGTIVTSLLRSTLFFYVCMRASVRLHDNMFLSISQATMKFFNTNPSGRILNRFSKDMGAIDELLPIAMIDTAQLLLNMIGVVVIISTINFILIIPLSIILITFLLLRMIYIRTSSSLKRLEGITRSPVYSHVSATILGLPTIRSFKMEKKLWQEFDSHQDLHSSAWFLFIAVSRAFGYWLDIGCLLFIATVVYTFLLMSSGGYAGSIGIAITQCISLTGVFQWGVRQSAELENQMTSVERVLEYNNIEHEGPLHSSTDSKPPPEWPSTGDVEFKNVSLYYNSLAPPVLKNVSFFVETNSKIGIVGRTGAGKSSLIAALFRMTPLEGTIFIDHRDTGLMGLHDLRRKLSIIPQEPVLFSGSLRKNLDPFEEYPDDVLIMALKEVELMDIVRPEIGGLNRPLEQGGENLSIGQRQLVCLARALVRPNRILVLDEATANVDAKTDLLIQKAIYTHFRNCTVFTIAHRLHTVMTCDKILVLDAGNIVEYESPWELLQNPESFLTAFVKQTGPEMATLLVAMAKVPSNAVVVVAEPNTSIKSVSMSLTASEKTEHITYPDPSIRSARSIDVIDDEDEEEVDLTNLSGSTQPEADKKPNPKRKKNKK